MTIQTKRQSLHMLLVHNHMIQAKQHILAVYGAERIRDLDEHDLDECIERMMIIGEERYHKNNPEIRHWRHKCLRAMSSFVNTQDWNNVNSFMLNPRVAGKHLYELSLDELKTMHRKINKIAQVMKARDMKLKNQAMNN